MTRRPVLLVVFVMTMAVLLAQQPVLAGNEPYGTHVEHPGEHSWREVLEQTSRRLVQSDATADVTTPLTALLPQQCGSDDNTHPSTVPAAPVSSSNIASSLVLLQVFRT